MGKLKTFFIQLTNQYGVYYPGQNIEGSVTVELNDAMKMRGVRLQFRGSAYVHWTERHHTGSGKNRRTETRHYSASELYFNFEVLLFGPGSGSTMLNAGSHCFPFTYTLPINLPSSYESHIGNVRYQLKAVIDKPWKFDHKTKKMFTVIAMLDLNLDPCAMNPAQGENSKNLCCLCCKSGPITATFQIDRQGYVPGESIYISADISNNSSRKMDASRVRLIMYTSYHATSKTKTLSSEVARISHGEIQPYGTDRWSAEKMVIPAVPPSYLVGCNIIDIRYVLMLEVDPSGPAFDLEVPLNIVIGTIPLRQALPQNFQGFAPVVNQPMPLQPMQPGLPPTAPMASTPSMPPPPSYAECVFGKSSVAEEDDNEHTGGDKEFAPVYTYYDWSKSDFSK